MLKQLLKCKKKNVKTIALEIEAQYARIRVLEEEVALARKEKDQEENFKNKALQEVQVSFILFFSFVPFSVQCDSKC